MKKLLLAGAISRALFLHCNQSIARGFFSEIALFYRKFIGEIYNINFQCRCSALSNVSQNRA